METEDPVRENLDLAWEDKKTNVEGYCPLENMVDLMSVASGLLLAALAVGPTLVGVYLQRRAQRGRGSPPGIPEALAAFPPPVPFNYPPPVLRELPRETEGLDTQGVGEADPADWWKGEGGQDT